MKPISSIMKIVTLLLFYATSITTFSQKQFELKPYAGANIPLGNFSEFSENGIDFGIAADYFFMPNFGLGFDINQQRNNFKSTLDFSRVSESSSGIIPHSIIESSEGSWKSTTISFGPTYRYTLNKITTDLYAKAGVTLLSSPEASTVYDWDLYQNDLFRLNKQNLTTFGLTSGISISYAISKTFSVFINPQYVYAQSKVEYTLTDIEPAFGFDPAVFPDGFSPDELLRQTPQSANFNPNYFNVNVGVIYKLGKASSQRKPKRSGNSGPISPTSLTEVDKDKKNEEKPNRRIESVSPANNSSYKKGSDIKQLKWKVIGDKFNYTPSYIVELIPMDGKSATMTATTSKSTVNIKELIKDRELKGAYQWKITETKSGLSTNKSTITVFNCDIEMALENVEIECEGYEGANRKYKVCYDINYGQSVGDLTYNNTTLSGLFVTDQANNNLSHTLVGTNTSLQTQTGTSTSIVHYCFETIVDSSVTNITFKQQGDNLDTQADCIPGVHATIDSLPSCLCKECDEIIIDVTKANFEENSSAPGTYILSGNINAGVAIYGVQCQIQSISYTSTPSACSNGVSTIEQSGVFNTNGTKINSSTDVIFYNETSSGSTNSNNNVSKNIKYSSNTAMNGNVPFELSLGLPSPLDGLDAGCCTMDYNVCIKFKIYYESGSCKTCSTTKCFTLSNQ